MTSGKGVGVVLVGDPHKTDPASWWEDRRRWAHHAIIGDELRSGTLVPVTTTARLYPRTSRSSSFAAPSRTSLVMGSRSSWGSTACGWTCNRRGRPLTSSAASADELRCGTGP